MKIKTLFAVACVFLNSGSAFAYGALTCSQNGTIVLFTNGIYTDRDESGANLRAIKDLKLNSQIDSAGAVDYDLTYNTHVGSLADIFEAIVQLIAQRTNVSLTEAAQTFWRVLNGTTQISEPLASDIRALLVLKLQHSGSPLIQNIEDAALDYLALQSQGLKILAIGHSQGTLLINAAYAHALSNSQFKANLFGAVFVGTPASTIFPQGKYVTYAEDLIINFLRSSFPSILPANADPVSFSFGTLFNLRAWAGHFFFETYLAGISEYSPVKTKVVEAIVESAKLLGPNCQGCANPLTGETQVGGYHKNPDGSKGGFVSATAQVDPTVYLQSSSMVCDTARVFNFSTVVGNTLIANRALVSKNVFVQDSRILDDAVVYDNVTFISSTIKDTAIFRGDRTSAVSWNAYAGPGQGGRGVLIEGNSKLYMATLTDSVTISGEPDGSGVVIMLSILHSLYPGEHIAVTGNARVLNSYAEGTFSLSDNAVMYHSFIGRGMGQVFIASGNADIQNMLIGEASINVPGGYVRNVAFVDGFAGTITNYENGVCAPWVNTPSNCQEGFPEWADLSHLPTFVPAQFPPVPPQSPASP
jgi:hypothetical protein